MQNVIKSYLAYLESALEEPLEQEEKQMWLVIVSLRRKEWFAIGSEIGECKWK
jgi:hypothetical protein